MMIIYFFLILGVAGGLEQGSLTIAQTAIIELVLIALSAIEYKRIERRNARSGRH